MTTQTSCSTPVVILLVFGLAAAPAYADFFVGGTIGQSDIGSYEFGDDTVQENDDSDTAYDLFLGWQPLEWLAVTAGYTDFGELKVAGSFDDEGTVNYTDQIEATAWDVSLIGILGFDRFAREGSFLARMAVFAQLGVARWDQDISWMDDISGAWSGGDDGTNAVYGLGLNFGVTDNLGIHVRWADYGDIGDEDDPNSGHEQDWAMWGIGGTWSFGGN